MKNKKNSFYLAAAIFMVLLTIFFIIVFSPGVTSSVLDPIPSSPSSYEGSVENGIAENPDYSKVDINRGNIRSVVRAMARPTEYYYETRSTLNYGSGSKSYPRKTWVRGALSRVDTISENGNTTMTTLYTGEHLYMWRPGSSRYYKTGVGDFVPESTQMMMVYQDILLLDEENILDAKYTQYDSVPCLYVEASNPETGYRSRYWVSTDTGLLVYGQALNADGTVIYTVESVQVILGTQDSSVFLLPDGSSVTAE